MLQNSPLARWLSHHPLRAAALFGCIFLLLALGWGVLRQPATPESGPFLYGEAFVARGFEPRRVGATLSLPTVERGTQQSPAIAIVENLAIPAAAYPYAELRLREREPGHRVALIWRNSVSPNTTQRLELDPSAHPSERINLASHRGWVGTISGIGVAAGHPSAAPLLLESLSFPDGRFSHRIERVLGEVQVALSRPIPGQESVARAWRIWPLAWMVLAGSVLAMLVAVWPGRLLNFRAACLSALAVAAFLQVGLYSARALVIADAPRTASQTRLDTLAGINSALREAKPEQRIHLWSGDGRGHELALALAPRRTSVVLGSQPLPSAQSIAPGDWIITLGRRGVLYSPQAGTAAWTLADGTVTQVRANVAFAAGGDAVFKVVSP